MMTNVNKQYPESHGSGTSNMILHKEKKLATQYNFQACRRNGMYAEFESLIIL